MKIEDIDMEVDFTDDHFKILKEYSNTIHYSSLLPFIRCHNGWRKGNLHVFLGKTSGGKSTLMRTLLMDALNSNQSSLTVGVILSEEKKTSFLSEFNYSGKLTPLVKRLKVVSEQDYPQLRTSTKEWDAIFQRMCDEGCDIIFYDNPTTSQTYSNDFQKQSIRAGEYKQMAIRNNIPFVLFTHTAGVNENFNQLISEDHMRGSKELVNQAEFFYAMQTINEGNQRWGFLRILKHRGQEVDNFVYSLGFDPKFRAYGNVSEVDFKKMADTFKLRNKL